MRSIIDRKRALLKSSNSFNRKYKIQPSRCPVDGEALDTNKIFTDTAFQKQIEDVKIICCYSSHGCSWEGTIQSLTEHREDCEFVNVICEKGCGSTLLKYQLESHICLDPSTPSLQQELALCNSAFMENGEFVDDHDCTMESRPGPEGESSRTMPTSSEEPASPSISGDGASLKFCKFIKLGCKFKGNRFEVDLHMDIASETHLDLVCKSINEIKTEYIKKENKVIAKHDNKIKLVQDYICKQNVVIKDLHETNRTLETNSRNMQNQIKDLASKTEMFMEEITRLKVQANQLQEEMNESRDTNFTGSLLWKIKNFSKHMQNAVNKTELSVYSPPFFTSRYGYKVRAQLFVNGLGSQTGEYMAIYFHILPSEHDDILRWPFNHKITFSLLEQTPDQTNVTYTLVPTPNEDSYKRPSDKMSDGKGFNRFISLDALKKGKYIKNDSIFVKIRVHCKNTSRNHES
ncbi:TNF receptor-associated factor 3-like isoform X2 [Clytia hemisphaerica]|uniref:TNF receptor-associated factor 3-like isoform X2 n=1 Tax=Clytia hemisphaerica TaxID=252671 RepID=UPI0034D5D3DE